MNETGGSVVSVIGCPVPSPALLHIPVLSSVSFTDRRFTLPHHPLGDWLRHDIRTRITNHNYPVTCAPTGARGHEDAISLAVTRRAAACGSRRRPRQVFLFSDH